MDRREEARKYFEKIGLLYSNITMLDIYKLIQLLNVIKDVLKLKLKSVIVDSKKVL